MNKKKIIGLILVLIGAGLIVFACVLSKKVQQGEVKIQRSQNTVNTIRKFSNMNPNTKPIGRIATQPIQRKINQGKKEAATFKGISVWGLVSGVVLSSAGVILFVLGFLKASKKPKRRTASGSDKKNKK